MAWCKLILLADSTSAQWSDFQSQLASQTVLLFPKNANKHRYRWKKPDVERFAQAMHHQCS